MNHRILIIGGTLAGLTTALRLIPHGYHISILDRKPIDSTESHELQTFPRQLPLDSDKHSHPCGSSQNPPFVLHGFQEETWALLKELGTLSLITKEKPTRFDFFHPSRGIVHFRPFPLPSPLHSIIGLLFFQGLSLRDRWRLLNALEKWWEQPKDHSMNMENHSAESWLSVLGQSQQARQEVWNPLCQYFFGDHLHSTSARCFSDILAKVFLSKRTGVKTLVSSLGNSHVLIAPLIELLQAKGVLFYPSTLITQFQCDSHSITGIKLDDGRVLTADSYVSTLAPRSLSTFLPERWLTKYSYFCNLSHLHEIPAVVVKFRISHPSVHTKLLLSSKTFHWITSWPENLSRHHSTSTISCIATGNPSLLQQSDDRILKQALLDTQESLLIPNVQNSLRPLNTSVARQPKAFLPAKPGISTFRPLQQSPIANLFLAGALTDTGLLDFRESSIRSGTLCAQEIMNRDQTEFVDKSV